MMGTTSLMSTSKMMSVATQMVHSQNEVYSSIKDPYPSDVYDYPDDPYQTDGNRSYTSKSYGTGHFQHRNAHAAIPNSKHIER